MQGQQQQVQCVCGTIFHVTVKVPQIINTEILSMLAFLHEEPEKCPNCGSCYQMELTAVAGLKVGWRQQAPKAENRLVDLATPGDLNALPPAPGDQG